MSRKKRVNGHAVHSPSSPIASLVSPESSTPAKLGKKSRAADQKRYRERKKRLSEYPNLDRFLKERKERLKRDPVYQLKKREARLAKRRELRRQRKANGVPNKVGKLTPKRSGVRPGVLRALPGESRKKVRGGVGVSEVESFRDLRAVTAMYALGLSDAEVAEVMGVDRGVWRKWLSVSAKLRSAKQPGANRADINVLKSLYKKAVGFTVPEEKVFVHSQTGKVTRVTTNKYYAPDSTALFFWLKNRHKGSWSDSKEIEHKGDTPGINREVKIVVVSAPNREENSNNNCSLEEKEKNTVIDADFKVLPAPNKTGESNG